MVRRTASRRLSWPSSRFSQVGVVESSKSAMKTFAPELSALMIILRSTGPVISTRRSSRSAGSGATVHVGFADGGGFGEEVGALAGVEAKLAGFARGEEFLAARVELALEQRRRRRELRA